MSEARAEDFLVTRFGGGIGGVNRIGHGEWSEAFTFDRDGAGYIVRFSALLEDFAKDRLAVRYGSRDLPIPRIVEIGGAFGGFYAISERAYGEYLDQLELARMRAALPSLLAVLDAARLVDVSASVGYGRWGADGSAASSSWRETLLDVANDRPTQRTHGWRERLVASPTGLGPFEEAYGQLESLASYAPEERHLIHGDLLNYNVLVQRDRISAVIDWGCSMYGDFLYDVAWFAFWSPWYPAWQGIDFGHEAARHYESIGLDVPNLEERLRCYQVHIGLDGQAYSAFKERWAAVDQTAKRTVEIAQGGR